MREVYDKFDYARSWSNARLGPPGASMNIVNRLLRWLDVPINLLLWVGLIAGFAMMVHVGIDVTGRTFFNRPLMGTTEIVANWYMVAIAFLPWAWIEQRNSHIVAGMFERIGGPRFDFWLGVVVKVFTLVFVARVHLADLGPGRAEHRRRRGCGGRRRLHPGMAEPVAVADRRRVDGSLYGASRRRRPRRPEAALSRRKGRGTWIR